MTKHPDRQAPGFDYKEWMAGKQARAPQLVGPWVEAIRRDYGSPDSKYVCVGKCAFPSQAGQYSEVHDRILLRGAVRVRVPHKGLDTGRSAPSIGDV